MLSFAVGVLIHFFYALALVLFVVVLEDFAAKCMIPGAQILGTEAPKSVHYKLLCSFQYVSASCFCAYVVDGKTFLYNVF